MSREEQILDIIEKESQKCKDWYERCRNGEKKLVERIESGELKSPYWSHDKLWYADTSTGIALECYKTVMRIKDQISEL